MDSKIEMVRKAIKDLPEEAIELLNIIDEVEEHTIALRKKLMAELRPNGNIIHLKLDDIK